MDKGFDHRDAEAFLHLTGELLCTGDSEGRFLKLSDGWSNALGYRAEELVGHHFAEFLHPADVQVTEAAMSRLLAGEAVVGLENRFRHRDGGWRWLQWRALADETGIIRAVARDVSDRAQLELNLRDSEGILSRSQSIARVGHFTYDVESGRVHASRSVRALFGLVDTMPTTMDEWLALLGPETRDRLRSTFVEGRLEGDACVALEEEFPVHRADTGQEIWIRCLGDVTCDSDGRPIRVFGVVKDVTARRAAALGVEADVRLDAALRELATHAFPTFESLIDRALDLAVDLTDSEYGYIYYYDEETEVFANHAWSANVMEACSVHGQPTRYELAKTGIWGEVVRQRKAMYLNDFKAPNPLRKGLPEGHAPIRSWMSVPIFIGGRIVGVGGVANRREPYSDEDTRRLSLMMETVWALAERQRVQDEIESMAGLLSESQRLGRVGSFRRNMNTGIVEISEMGREIFGRCWEANDSPSVQTVLECYHPDDRARVADEIESAWSGEGVREFSARIVHPDDSIVHVQVRLATLPDSQGTPLWILGNIADVTELRASEREILEHQERLRRLASKIAQLEEHERRRFAVELHDRVSQPLAAAKLRLQLLQEDCPHLTPCDESTSVMDMIEQAIVESRSLLTELSPPHVYEIGLRAALDWLREAYEKNGLLVRVDYRDDLPELDQDARSFMFQAAREFLANVAKHAHVSEASILVTCRDDHVVLTVEDAGSGFDLDALSLLPDIDHGFGLFSLLERAGSAGAHVDIDSSPGHGTRASVRLQSPVGCGSTSESTHRGP